MSELLIATWFVADRPDEATYFPQIGRHSADAGAKAVYWRCILCFYATSLALNPDHPHAFFTNTDLPSVDGIDVARLFARWGVEVVRLPIRYRVPPGRVDSWGNQFYIFDVIDHLVAVRRWRSAIILDSDVVWTKPAGAIAERVARDGVLTYTHDLDAYAAGAPINGVTREELAAFMARHGGPRRDSIVYCGGEIFCGTLDAMARIAARVPPLWQAVLAGEEGAPKEEAHLLSLIYAMEDMPIGNADDVIKRMWTTFHHHTVTTADLALPLWHLPSEKRSGFPDLFAQLRAAGLESNAPADLGITPGMMARIFGIPRRSAGKLIRDLSAKIGDKASAYRRKFGRRAA